MARWWDGAARRWALAIGVVLFSSCMLNPQPEVPLGRDSDEGANGPGSGGAGAASGLGGAAATGGSSIVIGAGGAPGASGGSAQDTTGECVAIGDDVALDSIDDCDASIDLADGRLGAWFAYDSNPEVPGTQSPATDATFAMERDALRDQCAVHVTGGGFTSDPDFGVGWAGVGIRFFASEQSPCASGYDAAAFDGVGLIARGTGALRVLVETVDTEVASGRPNGYAVVVPLTPDWAPVVVRWTDLALLLPEASLPATTDGSGIVTLRFEPADASGYDFWLDDLAFLPGTVAPGGQGGAGGATSPDTVPPGVAGTAGAR